MSLSGISSTSTDCLSISSNKQCKDSIEINGYKLSKIVGQGTFGSVYEA